MGRSPMSKSRASPRYGDEIDDPYDMVNYHDDRDHRDDDDDNDVDDQTEVGTVEVEMRKNQSSRGGGGIGSNDKIIVGGSADYTNGEPNSVYDMGTGSQIVYELRNVGVNVLSIENESDIISYLDAVCDERMVGEQCLLHTDDLGRAFNVIVSGGAEGLASAWASVQSTYSGWAACACLPFVARILACTADLSFKSGSYTVTQTPSMGLHPGFVLVIFGVVLQSETSLSWLATSLHVRGTNSVGAHVWRSAVLADYPRYFTLLLLGLAWFAPFGTPGRDLMTALGSGFGGALILANLGSRAWKKLNLSCIDGHPVLTFLMAIIAGLCFPYLGMRSVTGGCGKDSDDFAFPNGGSRRARQLVTVGAATTAIVFGVTNLQSVQEALGFAFRHQGPVNLSVGLWWILSTAACLFGCGRLITTPSHSAQPFLSWDESSPVGWCVPSLPKVMVDPTYRGKPYGCCGPLSDALSAILVVVLGGALIWQGIQQISGKSEATPWSFAT